jgi:hypothetical protein
MKNLAYIFQRKDIKKWSKRYQEKGNREFSEIQLSKKIIGDIFFCQFDLLSISLS